MALAQDNEAATYAAISERLAKARLRCRLRTWRPSLVALVHLFLAWRRNNAEQRYLACLSDRDLRDLGLLRDNVADASLPPLWFR